LLRVGWPPEAQKAQEVYAVLFPHRRGAQELMRHSDVRLTMKICTDASKLPLAEGAAALPSFKVGNTVPSLPKSCPLKIING
jgi:hypothetical protein